MKSKIYFSLCFVCFYLFLACPVFSYDFSVAIKEGYHIYDKNAKSVYIGNNIYDNEWSVLGGYARIREGKLFARVEYEHVNTGDEFSQSLNFPYEGVHLRQESVLFGGGVFLEKWLYVGLGGGIGFDEYQILTFADFPIRMKTIPSFVGSFYIGAEKNIWRNFYLFAEYKRNFERVKIKYTGFAPGNNPYSNAIKETLDANTFYAGIGWKF